MRTTRIGRVAGPLVSVATTILVAAATACRSSDEAIGYQELSERIAASFCGALNACCDAAGFAYDHGSCVSQVVSLYQSAASQYKVNPLVTYDGNEARRCADAVAARESQCAGFDWNDTSYADPVVLACAHVFEGTRRRGEECLSPLDCAAAGPASEPRCDHEPGGGGPAVCFVTRADGKPGDACASNAAELTPTGDDEQVLCSPDLGYCSMGSSGKGICVAWKPLGAECTPYTPDCEPNRAYCTPTSGRCERLPAAGEPCPYQQCKAGARCNESGVCVALFAEGAPCTAEKECESGACGGRPDWSPFPQCLASGSVYAVSPRTCGFGPYASSSDYAGIAPRVFGLPR